MSTIRQLSGTVASIPGVENPSIDSLSIELNVNKVPAATVTFHEATDQVKTAINAQVIQTMSDMQTILFSDRSAPDVTVTATDGKDNSLAIVGYLTAPVSQAVFGRINQQASLVCSDTIVDALDLSIYNVPPSVAKANNENLKYEDYVPLDIADSGDLAQLITNIVNNLVENFGPSQASRSEADRQAAQLKHDNNTFEGGPLDTFLEILDNSDIVYTSWEETFKDTSLAYDVVERLVNILRAGPPAFWGSIRALLAEFRLLYIPNPSGAGRFIRADQVALGDTEERELEIKGESLGAGSKRILPLGAVIVRGNLRPSVAGSTAQGGTGENSSSLDGTPNAQAVAQFPEEIQGGWTQDVKAPIWLDTPVRKLYKPKANAQEVAEEFAKDVARNISLNIPQMLARVTTNMQAVIAKQEDIRGKLLLEFAEVIYHELQLADSTATVNLPMDVSISPGQRYEIFSEGGVRLGTAFVSRVTHSMQVNTNTLDASTTLHLTHVDYRTA